MSRRIRSLFQILFPSMDVWGIYIPLESAGKRGRKCSWLYHSAVYTGTTSHQFFQCTQVGGLDHCGCCVGELLCLCFKCLSQKKKKMDYCRQFGRQSKPFHVRSSLVNSALNWDCEIKQFVVVLFYYYYFSDVVAAIKEAQDKVEHVIKSLTLGRPLQNGIGDERKMFAEWRRSHLLSAERVIQAARPTINHFRTAEERSDVRAAAKNRERFWQHNSNSL